MKVALSFLVSLMICSAIFAQAPEAFKYQAVVRDAGGQPRVETDITLVISIRRDSPAGQAVYSETHQVQTNAFGLVNLEIGRGTSTDNFSAIDWASGTYFVAVIIDNVEFGASQLLSVPFALYAERAGNTFSGDYKDLQNAPDLSNHVVVSNAQEGNFITYDGNNWIAKDLLITADPSGGGQPFSILSPYATVSYCIALQGVFPSRSGLEPFIGEIMLFAGNFAPRGWAFCDGQLLSIAQNTALFSILGTTYGGDGRTTFGLPDLRGRAPLHAGTGPGLSPRSLGQTGGSETQVITIQQLPPHSHQIRKQ